MLKVVLVFFIFLSTSFAQATFEIQPHYSKAADLFNLMDNVSQWWDGFTEPEYRIAWEKRVGPLSETDNDLIKRYQKLREKYYNDPDQKEKDPLKNRNGLFSTLGSVTADPVAEAFYDADSLEKAYATVKKTLASDELSFIKDFFAHFETRAAIFLEESARFKSAVASAKKSFARKEVAQYFSEVTAFYGVQNPGKYKILFTWFPPINRSNASPSGRYLIMRYNPIEHLASAEADSDIAFHEVVHAISAQQPLDQKQKITEEFLQKCAVKERLKRLTILEEPLAVVFGQALYLERFDAQRLKLDESLYENAWISTFAKLLLPIARNELKMKRSIKAGFIASAGNICRELVAASEQLGPPQK